MRYPLAHLFAIFILLTYPLFAQKGGRSGRSTGSSTSVRGYVRKDGTYVAPHHRSAPDGNFQNNWSTSGNINPYTGVEGTRVTPPPKPGLSPGSTFLVPEVPQPPLPRLPILDLSAPTLTPPSAPNHQRLAPSNRPSSYNNYRETAKKRDIDRSEFWRQKGYEFDHNYMTAYSMDRKVIDIERARHWKAKGYEFDPNYMTAYSMDRKIIDIGRAHFWKEKGYTFDPNYMTAYSMDRKVQDIERSKYWQIRGLSFNPDYMTAYSMDREAAKLDNKPK